MTPRPYVLASSTVPDDTPSLLAVDPSLGQPGPRPVDGGKVSSTASQSTDRDARQPTVADVTEHARARAEEPRHRRAIPSTNVSDGAAAHGKFFPPLPKLEPAHLLLPRAYKKSPSTPRSSTPSPLPIPAFPYSSPSQKRPKSASPSHRVRENSGRRWSRRWCKVEESSRRRRSASSPSSSASPTSSPPSSSFPCQRR
jgi:hypothetical protein